MEKGTDDDPSDGWTVDCFRKEYNNAVLYYDIISGDGDGWSEDKYYRTCDEEWNCLPSKRSISGIMHLTSITAWMIIHMAAVPGCSCRQNLYTSVTEHWKTRIGKRCRSVVYLSPQGQTFNQKMAEEFAEEEELVFLCGHYEGIDERVLEEIVTDYVSIGDYVLTGGELPSMVMVDAISRLVPGVLHNDVSAEFESFQDNLLEYPQYSRPETWHDKKVSGSSDVRSPCQY